MNASQYLVYRFLTRTVDTRLTYLDKKLILGFTFAERRDIERIINETKTFELKHHRLLHILLFSVWLPYPNQAVNEYVNRYAERIVKMFDLRAVDEFNTVLYVLFKSNEQYLNGEHIDKLKARLSDLLQIVAKKEGA